MTKHDAFALLDWHLRYVAEDVWSHEPHNWFATPNLTEKIHPPLNMPAKKTSTHLFSEPKQISQWLSIAEQSAREATTIAELKQAVEDFQGCEVRKFAQRTVFCGGKTQSRLLLLGEAPGEEEDRQGKPFVGESGRLLTSMLSSIGYTRENDFLLSNVFYWRPPGNRQPTTHELLLCRPFVLRLIELQRPEAVLLLGRSAATSLFGAGLSITRIRGIWRELKVSDDFTSAALPSYHPAFLLRQPSRKAESWQDMLTLRRKIAETK